MWPWRVGIFRLLGLVRQSNKRDGIVTFYGTVTCFLMSCQVSKNHWTTSLWLSQSKLWVFLPLLYQTENVVGLFRSVDFHDFPLDLMILPKQYQNPDFSVGQIDQIVSMILQIQPVANVLPVFAIVFAFLADLRTRKRV